MLAGTKLGGNERGGNSLKRHHERADVVHRAVDLPDMVELPVPEGIGRDVGPFERVLKQIEDLLQTQFGEGLRPNLHRPR